METQERKARINQALVFEFATAMREIRRSKGLTQEQVAFGANVHRTYIAFLEGGKRQPSIDGLFRVARGLDVKPSELVALIESRYSLPSE